MKATKTKRKYNTPVLVLQGGKVVERYANVKAFYEVYGSRKTYMTIYERIIRLRDGWMPGGKVARMEGDEGKEGNPLRLSMVRSREQIIPNKTKRETLEDDIEQTERKIDNLYRMYYDGEITIEERQTQIGWLQNHLKVLKNRMKRNRR